MNITTATPREIDTALAEIYGRIGEKQWEIQNIDIAIQEAQTSLNPNYRFFREHEVERNAKRLAKLEAKLVETVLAMNVIRKETVPFDEEFDRRGGWTRAWLVDNTGGHVHNTMSCSTCFPTTRFGWLPEWSGRDEAEIIDAAGCGACTVCYPNAPVDKPMTIELADKKAARLDREAAKAERDAKKAAKAIGPLNVYCSIYNSIEPIKTLAAARAYLTEHFCSEFAPEGQWYKPKPADDLNLVLTAVAQKESKEVEEVIAEALKRAKSRIKREGW